MSTEKEISRFLDNRNLLISQIRENLNQCELFVMWGWIRPVDDIVSYIRNLLTKCYIRNIRNRVYIDPDKKMRVIIVPSRYWSATVGLEINAYYEIDYLYDEFIMAFKGFVFEHQIYDLYSLRRKATLFRDILDASVEVYDNSLDIFGMGLDNG